MIVIVVAIMVVMAMTIVVRAVPVIAMRGHDAAAQRQGAQQHAGGDEKSWQESAHGRFLGGGDACGITRAR